MEPNFFFKVFTLSEKGITSSKSIIDKKFINSNLYSCSKHLFYKTSYKVHNNELIASLGKEFLNLTTNSLYKNQPILEENEFVSNFCFSGDYIIYTTEKFEREKNITHEHGFLTTLNQSFVKVIDIKTKELIFAKELDAKGIYTISPSNSIYEYIENKDSLNIKKISIQFKE
jgi:Fe2+ or Zn2+ uptake regulation protein